MSELVWNQAFWDGFTKEAGFVDAAGRYVGQAAEAIGGMLGRGQAARASVGEGVKRFQKGVQSKVQGAQQATQKMVERVKLVLAKHR
jgi:hypothetical protein